MENIELKPCPFCGGKAYLEEYSLKEIPALRNTRYHKAHKIGCKSCQIYFLEKSILTVDYGELKFIENGLEKCLNKWNKRSDNA
ncbi:MAG: Lar family restriction alleviation protein [Oscillospiraceae bacterium]